MSSWLMFGEAAIFQYINNLALRYFWLDAFEIFLAKYLAYFMVAGLILFWLFYLKKYRLLFLEAILAVALSRLVLVEIIRLFIFRARPFLQENVNLLLAHSSPASFPSGHASVFFALAIVVFLHHRLAGVLFFIGACLMGAGRIFTGLHWPADILGGAFTGILAGACVHWCFKTRHSER